MVNQKNDFLFQEQLKFELRNGILAFERLKELNVGDGFVWKERGKLVSYILHTREREVKRGACKLMKL